MLGQLRTLVPFRKTQQQEPIEVYSYMIISQYINKCKLFRKKSQMMEKSNEKNGIDRLNSFFH
jgi:hypothetical protein